MERNPDWIEIINSPDHPISKIASRIEPFLRVLIEDFQPKHVVLFGSYAYGNPTKHSDVDLLVIKSMTQSARAETIAIHRRWREVVGRQSIPIDLLLESQESHQERLKLGGAFYREINQRGLSLL
jgi:predicted nucleotidyltransferase